MIFKSWFFTDRKVAGEKLLKRKFSDTCHDTQR